TCSGHADGPYHSVWYSWTAPEDGTVTFDTCTGSTDTLLAAYTGSTLGSLARQAESDDGCGFYSKITFAVTAATTYRIQVDGAINQTGSFTLRWALTPANDEFANAKAIGGASGSINGSNVYAGNQANEPATCVDCQGTWDGPRKTVWYAWTAPASGAAT